ncbi:similar to Saccharomyces cerevisiae YGR111W Putative protein of unknown function [Maudiozyma barnettii]|uniref:LYC1 C-terminal domain-containing protein n=1 Tax=Maudiozyma barnettii TaxID=61262 RepID=A0A8H2VAV5_9SACH|nr:hypothetical protein [Kazachstania barnettii]CAB4251878.1 similar to Saccharomyces cerevisiae YGR111W Putative protein of unknown function [Kazachstania barnettii]CAD1778177.1 similar to Saccharomyces cerevisiae YGR111W Putative protein of unknown function [Kazachstania barnettii]
MTNNSTYLTFEKYDDPEIKRFTHMNNGEAWQGLLPRDQYADREQYLSESGIAQKNQDPATQKLYPEGCEWFGIKFFALKDRRLPATGKTSQIVSSCETLNRLAYCTTSGSDGKIELCLNVCIGGVFTEKKFRGQGYAKAMIESLNKYYDELRATPGAPDFIKNLVITLYSEVGDYYTQLGYHTLHVPLHNITHIDELYQEYCGGVDSAPGRFLGFDDYEDLIHLQDNEFKKDLLTTNGANKDSFIFMVKPDIEIFKWFQYRDIFIQERTNNGTTQPPFGFELENHSHIIWHHNWNDNKLVITKIYISEDQKMNSEVVLRQLFAKAINEARKTNLDVLQFWDFEISLNEFPQLRDVLKEVCDDDELYAQNGSISAVRPPPGYNKDTIIWEKNTKFCWF